MSSTQDSPLAANLPSPGSLLAGKYRIEALLGRGGMGAVYKATNIVTEKSVAIKWLLSGGSDDKLARERFVREAQAAARIPHPNVVDVYDVLEHEGSMFLVMEYLVGEPFSARLARGGMGTAELTNLILPAMRAVSAAHGRGVIHRDIKPENLFICARDDGTRMLKVLDFGISKIVVASREGHESLTRSGSAVGTPRYMPLEQLSGERDVDGRVDVYAFGVILYQALTGQLPFDGDSYGAIAIRVATHTPPLPRTLKPDIPPLLERVVLGAIARQRDARFATMHDMIRALENALDPRADMAATLSATRPALAAPAQSTPRESFAAAEPKAEPARAPKPWKASAIVALAAIVLLSVLGWFFLQEDEPALEAREPALEAPPAASSTEPPTFAHPDVPAVPPSSPLPSAPPPETSAQPAPAAKKPATASAAKAKSRNTIGASENTPIAPEPVAAPAPASPPASASGQGKTPEDERGPMKHRAGELEKTQF